MLNMLAALQPSLVTGRTWVVAHAGGDVDSLAAACRMAASGDTIRIEPGRYAADQGFPPKPFILVREKSLTIVGGESRPASVVLVSHRLFLQQCELTTIRGIRFEEGESAVVAGGTLKLEHCEFVGQQVKAVEISDRTAGVSIVQNCLFDGNGSRTDASAFGSAVTIHGSAQVERCDFLNNVATYQDGAVEASGTTNVSFCTFIGNEAPDGAAMGIAGGRDSGTVTNCTFYGNRVTATGGAALAVGTYGEYATVDRCIFAGTTGGVGLHCDGSVSNACNVFWQNERGNAVPEFLCPLVAEQIVDPMFCDAGHGDLRVKTGSPCLQGNYQHDPSCALIGAFDEGCPVSATARTTWGRIKARYGATR